MQPESYCLLIDNDEDDREVFALALSELSPELRCLSVAGGGEALRLMNDERVSLPAFVFIDMNMPGMDGRQCLAALRGLPRLASVPIYMYSTSADPRVVAQLEGIAGFIEKPTSFGALTEILSSIVQIKQD